MKRTLFMLLASMVAVAAMAQGHRPNHQPRPARHTVNVESRGGETFTVFVNGDVVNRMPQNRVMVSDLPSQTHQLVVIMRRPAQKAAVIDLRPAESNVTVTVSYDQRTDALTLYTPSHNLATDHPAPAHHPSAPGHHSGNTTVVQQVVVQPSQEPPAKPRQRGVSEDQFSGMMARMKAQSFDSDRLAMGKVIVASADLTASQIARLAGTLDHSSSQVDFLKYAYHYCIDPVNYYKTTDVLTFSSDKKKILDYIATQK